MKRLISLLTLTILVFSIIIPSFAATSTNITIKVNGKTVIFSNAKPCIEKGIVYIPIIPIASKLGAKTSIVKSSNTVVIKKGSKEIRFKIGESKATVNGKEVKLDAKTFSKSNKVYVSLGFISQTLSTTADWFSESKTAVVNDISKGEVPIYTRLWQSGEYELDDKSKKYSYGCDIRPKNKKYDYLLYVASDTVEKYELSIRIKSYDFKTRQKIKEILKICYPSKYNEAYKNLIGVLREEIYKLDWDIFNKPGITDIYYDKRFFSLVKQVYNSRCTYINIGTKNHIYAKLPKCDSQAEPSHSPNIKQEIKDNEIYYNK